MYHNEEITYIDRLHNQKPKYYYTPRDVYVINDSAYDVIVSGWSLAVVDIFAVREMAGLRKLNLEELVVNLDIKHDNRNEIEIDSKKQQLVVGLVIRQGSKLLLLECINGDMEGYLTIVQGHVRWDEEYLNKDLNFMLTENLIREISEEIVFPKNIDSRLSESLKTPEFIACNNFNDTITSWFHYGFIYELNLDKLSENESFDISEIISNEKDKNIARVIDIYSDDAKGKTDSWVTEIIDYYRYKQI